jgi:glycosyl transferase family 87
MRSTVSRKIALTLWTVVLVVICARIIVSPHRNDLFATYTDAGARWIRGESLYQTTSGFIYSPLVAAFFAPFSLLPHWLGAVIWRLANAATFLGAVGWWLKANLHEKIGVDQYPWVFLLLLPLALGNLNNGQVNPLMIGLVMIAILSAYTGHWKWSAFCIATVTYFKIYPISAGLLLVLIYPRKLAWRLVLALLIFGLFSFFLQHPAYVGEQYQRWFETRASDNRRLNIDVAPRDFAMILKAFHLVVSKELFLVLQLLAAAGAAAICLLGRIRQWTLKRQLANLLTLVSCWMLLFGPSTESATYVMLAPAMVLALAESLNERDSHPWLLFAAFAVLLTGLALNSFFNIRKNYYSMSVQPLGAVLFTLYALRRALRPERKALVS